MRHYLSAFALFSVVVLSGCAQKTTKDNFDCPVQDGVPACLTTQEADTMGELPKVAADVDVKEAVNIESEIEISGQKVTKNQVINQAEDTSYKVEPLIHQPSRSFGGTERIWFAAWQDTKNDLFIDQQYVYWSKPGSWIISEMNK